MAKVTTRKVFVAGAEYIRAIHVDTSGFFTAGFPKELREAMGVEQARGRTMAECVAEWETVRAEYEQSKVIVSRVICFQLVMAGGPLGGRSRGHVPFAIGANLQLAVGVFDERKRANSAKASSAAIWSYSDVASSIPAGFGFRREGPHTSNHPFGGGGAGRLPWSAEREAWFTGLCEAFGRLMLGLDEVFQSNERLLVAAAERRLLLVAGDPGVKVVDARRH